MVNVVTELSKYLLVIGISAYTYLCFAVFGYSSEHAKNNVMKMQRYIMFLIHFLSCSVLYLATQERRYLFFYLGQLMLFVTMFLLYESLYPKVSKLVLNNMCLMMAVGFIMVSRLDYDRAFRQFVITVGGVCISFVVPVLIRKIKNLSNLTILYAIAGIAALGFVAVAGAVSYGAKLSISIGGFGIQPSEFVKIIFVFFVASAFSKAADFKSVVKISIVAALHVLILVASTDLGGALIIFIVYVVMLYVATAQPLYILAGAAAGSVAAVVAHAMFDHVKTRVRIWKDPFASYDTGGYQIVQSLFAIGTGGWFGMGLMQGLPNRIPVASEDFIFAVISEEMGLLFSICILLICVSCYVMFLNIAMSLNNKFYKLVALGLGTCYIFQVFLTIGGATKFIPLTGVTLPFVSYGGSSMLSSLIMFAIIQGLYIVREDEEIESERQKVRRLRTMERDYEQRGERRQTTSEKGQERRKSNK